MGWPREGEIRNPSSSLSGLTLLETLVAMVVFGLLSWAVFAVFSQGGQAFQKVHDRGQLTRAAQLALGRLTQDLERTTFASISIVPDKALAMLSARDSQGVFVMNELGEPVWQLYRIYYLDSQRNLFLTEAALSPGDPEQATPGPLENWGAAQPVTAYCNGGRLVTTDVERFNPTFGAAPNTVRLILEVARPAPGEQRLRLMTSVTLRN